MEVRWKTSHPLAEITRSSALRATVFRDRIFVVDPSHSRLYALRLADGTLLWDSRVTAVAHSLETPHDVAVMRDGRVVVADMGRKALVVFDTTGRLMRSIPVGPAVYSLCASGDGVLMLTWSVKQPIWFLNIATGEIKRSELAWPDLRDALPDKTSGTLQSDAKRDACVFAREAGDGFAVWRNGHFGPPHAFVEHVVPQFGKQIQAAMSASLVGDDVYVAFGGSSKERRRLVDVYDATSGAYKMTITAPVQLYWLTPAGPGFIGISPTGRGRDIVAFAEREDQ